MQGCNESVVKLGKVRGGKCEMSEGQWKATGVRKWGRYSRLLSGTHLDEVHFSCLCLVTFLRVGDCFRLVSARRKACRQAVWKSKNAVMHIALIACCRFSF
ncbi:unnamed protein product [Ixodes persulcatus]